MSSRNTAPNLASCLQSMDLIYRIEVALAGNQGIAAFGIKQAIRNNKPANIIINTCKDMIEDNTNEMSFMLGMDLANRIKNFQP